MNKKIIKVLVLAHLFPNSAKPFLGVAVLDRIEAFRKHFDIKVLAPVPWAPSFKFLNPFWKYSQIPFKEKVKGLEIYHPRFFTFPKTFLYFLDGFTYFPAVYPLIKRIYKKWKFELIDAHQSFPDGFTSCLIRNILNPKIKVVTTVHGGDVFELPKIFLRRVFVIAGIRMSDGLMADSRLAVRKIHSLVPSVYVEIIPTGLTLNKETKPIPKEVLKKIKGKTAILTVGYLVERKGHKYVLMAVKDLVKKYKNLIYVIVGDGTEMKNLKNLVEKYNLSNHVIFAGGTIAPVVHSYYENCDIFVLASWEEALGVVYMEAMSHGKPVIGTKGEGAEELIDHGVNGYLVKRKNASQLKSYLEKLIRNPRLRAAFGNRGREKSFKVFRQAIRAEQVFEYFKKVLHG